MPNPDNKTDPNWFNDTEIVDPFQPLTDADIAWILKDIGLGL